MYYTTGSHNYLFEATKVQITKNPKIFLVHMFLNNIVILS